MSTYQTLAFPTHPLPTAPDVPAGELAGRLARLRREMSENDLDIVILSDKKNIEYFTDYRSLSWAYKARPIFLAVSNVDLVLFGALTESKNIAFKERNFTARLYDGYLPEAAGEIAAWLRGIARPARPFIGLDYGQDMLGRGTFELLEALESIVPRSHVRSAVREIWQVRLIKSSFEAEQKRIALRIVNRAFDDTVARARLGMAEYELCRLLQAQIYLNGAESADPIAMLFSKGDFIYSRPPSGRRLEPGHYVWTDFRATYGGYPADRNRIARAGEPAAWEIDTYSRARALTIELCNAIRPGMTCAELFAVFTRYWSDSGLGQSYGMVSRIGHGGGIDVTEPPSIAAYDTEVIRPGMILHVEPKLEHDGAVFQFEEVVFVTEAGIEFLSELSPPQLPVIK